MRVILWLFKPVTVDAVLWVSIALFTTMQSMLSNDDSYKYIDARVLFWMKFGVACAGSSAAALKAFRSTTYSQHISAQAKPANVSGVETVPVTEPQQPNV